MKNTYIRHYLINAETMFYRFWNDYLTVAVFAEHHGITERQANKIIQIGKKAWDKRTGGVK